MGECKLIEMSSEFGPRELGATVDAATFPKVSGRKAKARKRNADANVTMLNQ